MNNNLDDGPLFGDPNCELCKGFGWFKVYGQDIAFVPETEAEYDIVECKCSSPELHMIKSK